MGVQWKQIKVENEKVEIQINSYQKSGRIGFSTYPDVAGFLLINMANHRMFSHRIANSAKFLQMPAESQLLYFHMILRADDDGVVESYPLMKMLGLAPDNFKVLSAKGFIRQLNEDQVIIIVDWLEHNTIRPDRKVNSIYFDLIKEEAPELELVEPKPRADTGKPTGQPMDVHSPLKLSQDKISKVNLSELREEPSPREIASRFFSEEDNQEQESVISMLLEGGMSEQVARAEIKKFVMYWTELNSTGKKQRWEMEKTFEVKRRLTTWFAKVSQFKGFDKDKNKTKFAFT